MSEENRKPTFSELRDALMPPGTDREALWAALKSAHQTGGHVPGHEVPDISDPVTPGLQELADTIYRQEMRRCELHARADHPELFPPDPFSQGAPAAAALHEMFTDFLGAGFTEEQATSILGKMLAAYGKDAGDD